MDPRRTINPRTLPRSIDGELASRLVAAASDLAWVIDNAGVIQDVSAHLSPGYPDWQQLIGKRWSETVSPDSRAKAEALLADARGGELARHREINHPKDNGGGQVIPFRFSAAPLDGERVVAFGRDLSEVSSLHLEMVNAQQAMNREYTRLRQTELRYRLLFQASSEPVIIVDATSLKVLEMNAAASSVFWGLDKPQARALPELVEPDSVRVLERLVAATKAGGQVEPAEVSLLPKGNRAALSVSLFRQGFASQLLIRLLPTDGSWLRDSTRSVRLLAMIDALPDGLVVTDEDMRILCANPAFCEFVQEPSESQVVGQPLGRWLGHAGMEASLLLGNLKEHGLVRNFATVIGDDQGAQQEAVVSAVATEDGHEGRLYGLSIRVEPTRLAVIRATTDVQPRSVDQLQSLVGRVSLKEIVRESADLVERLCIEAALKVTGDNRASAAQLLGLSRQGLYSKLRRHGLGDLGSPTDTDSHTGRHTGSNPPEA